MAPRVRYARSGDSHIAYTVTGEGALDLIYVPGWLMHTEIFWEHPRVADYFGRLASFSRLIMFDRRGTGLSDSICGPITLEEQMDDVVAVMDAAGSRQAAVMAQLEGGAMAALFAATHPERTRALVLYAAMARTTPAPGYEWPPTEEEREASISTLLETWGDGSRLAAAAPTAAKDPANREWMAKLERYCAPPATAALLARALGATDVRHVLPSIQAPTLVLHRTNDRFIDVRHSRYIASRIRGARLVELPGEDTILAFTRQDRLLDEIQEFLTGTRRAAETDRVLATVLFTDIVGSTERAAELGDRAWREVLETHHERLEQEVARHRGKLVKTLGDGVLATFDGPARAIRAAVAARDAAAAQGLELRAGLHTGECEVVGEDVGGLAVHIGARVLALAEPGEVLASGTVKDLVVGSGTDFRDRGVHVLRGVPGEWRLWAVTG